MADRGDKYTKAFRGWAAKYAAEYSKSKKENYLIRGAGIFESQYVFFSRYIGFFFADGITSRFVKRFFGMQTAKRNKNR